MERAKNVMSRPDLTRLNTARGQILEPGMKVAYLVPAVMSVDTGNKVTVELQQAKLRVGVVKRLYERHAAWADFDGLYCLEVENGDRCNVDNAVVLEQPCPR